MTPTDIRKVVTVEADSYGWKQGASIKVSAADAVTELRRLYTVNRGVTPQAIVKAAEPKKAILHEHFEWDNKAAGQAYREQQARHILRSLVVVYKREDGTKTEPVRAYVKLMPNVDDPALDAVNEEAVQPHVYLPVRTVMDEPSLRQRIRRQAFRELSAWRQRYRDINEFARIFDEIDALAQREEQAS